MRLLVSVFLACVATASPALAQAEVQAGVEQQEPMPKLSWEAAPLPDIKPVQVPLDAALIERFLASLPELIGLARDLDRESGRPDQLKLKDDLAFLLVPHLFDPRIEDRVNERLAELGFASYGDWANTAHSIALAAEAAEFTGTIDLEAQEKAARRDIENDPKLSAEEKDRRIQDLRSQFAALAEFEPLAGNREAAAPYLDRLRAVTGGG